jgi:two-component system sensor histidine kinase UhpB
MPTLDWHRLQPIDILVDLPGETNTPGSTPSVREAHSWDFAAVVSLVAMQGVLIAACVAERYRRRRAEQAALANGWALRTSDERNSDLVGRLISAQEAERTRIARDLHDDACQEVAAITVEMGNLRHDVRDLQDPDVQEVLLSVQRRTARIAESLRLLSHDLHPSLLQHVGLVAALGAHCAEVERRHHMRVTFSPEGDVEPGDPHIVLTLFRIAQEAIRNAIRHGHAHQVAVSLVRTGAALELSVADDGDGFDVDGIRETGGLGLVSIEERARLAGGQVAIYSQPGEGTTIAVRVSMEAEAVRAARPLAV